MSIKQVHLKLALDKCREEAKAGLGNGKKAEIPALNLDYIDSHTFIGAAENPAIFVTALTHRKLGKFHPSWVPNRTIAVKEEVLHMDPVEAIGILVHETGHAFNVHGTIPNTEGNAYIFEIEIMMRWGGTTNNVLTTLGGMRGPVGRFLRGRSSMYQKEAGKDAYLDALRKKVTRF
jgi:hypothetical protein